MPAGMFLLGAISNDCYEHVNACHNITDNELYEQFIQITNSHQKEVTFLFPCCMCVGVVGETQVSSEQATEASELGYPKRTSLIYL